MCRADDADTPDVHRHDFRRGTKPYSCCDCHRQVEKGEEYHYIFMVLYGDPLTFRLCRHCHEAAGWLVRECGGYVLEGICEELAEHAAEYPHVADALAPLIAGIRAKWSDGDALMSLPDVPAVTIGELV